MEGIDAGSHPTGVSPGRRRGWAWYQAEKDTEQGGAGVDASVKERNGAVLVHVRFEGKESKYTVMLCANHSIENTLIKTLFLQS